jgi:hypothetical protein
VVIHNSRDLATLEEKDKFNVGNISMPWQDVGFNLAAEIVERAPCSLEPEVDGTRDGRHFDCNIS